MGRVRARIVAALNNDSFWAAMEKVGGAQQDRDHLTLCAEQGYLDPRGLDLVQASESVNNAWSDAAREASAAARAASAKVSTRQGLGAKTRKEHTAAANWHREEAERHTGMARSSKATEHWDKVDYHEKTATAHRDAAILHEKASRMALNRFCATGHGGGIDPTCGKDSDGSGNTPADRTSPPCCPAPAKPTYEHSRVGVQAMSVPPPPQDGIPRLPNLKPEERAVETRYAEAYLAHPDHFVDQYLAGLRNHEVGDGENVFGTDDVKMYNPDWNKDKDSMAQYNTAVHATANAIAKKAFVKYLDEVVAKYPEGDPKRSVLVTNGGCSAGKGTIIGYSQQHAGVVPAPHMVGAVWDAAGEQNATENEWIHHECSKRGIGMSFLFVHNTPDMDRIIGRAEKKGRMVDARMFADSYGEGAKNMFQFWQDHKGDKNCQFIFADNREKGKPKVLDHFPMEALHVDSDKVYKESLKVLKESSASPAIKKGGSDGEEIWGKPSRSRRS